MFAICESIRTRLACLTLAVLCVWRMHWSLYITQRELRRRHGIRWTASRFPRLSHREVIKSDIQVLSRAAKPTASMNLESIETRLWWIQLQITQTVSNRKSQRKLYSIHTLAGRRIAIAILSKLGKKLGLTGPLTMIREDIPQSTCLAQHLVSYLEAIGVGKPNADWRLARTLLLERIRVSRTIDLDAIRDEYRLQMLRTLSVPCAFLNATQWKGKSTSASKKDCHSSNTINVLNDVDN
jgi:hypothetical protein